MDQALLLRIRERAYHIWAANGGDADQNWFCAEAEIVNTSAAQRPEAQSQKKQRGAATRRKAKKNGFAWLNGTALRRAIPSWRLAFAQSFAW